MKNFKSYKQRRWISAHCGVIIKIHKMIFMMVMMWKLLYSFLKKVEIVITMELAHIFNELWEDSENGD